MLTLGLDTSSMRTAVGLVEDGKELASYEISGAINSSEELVTMVAEIFKKIKYEIEDLDLIGVGVGPGSYTGSRIAVTVARVFAQTLDKEIKAVSSLKSLCLNYEGDKIILPLLDARRNRAYYGIYKNKKANIETIKEDSVDELDKIKAQLMGEDVVILGRDCEKFFDYFKEDLNIISIPNHEIKGSNIARLAELEYKQDGPDDLLSVLPNYITKSQAERELEKRNA
jgi:tRNA threonylcarbamoyladenosine biosynthesis protein TsaB